MALLPPIVVMGVQGSGKSTVAELIARDIGGRFVDGDRLHSAANVAKMAAGIPLTHEDRGPWLQTIGRLLDSGRAERMVVVCSALHRSYRDLLRSEAPDAVFVHLHGEFELIAARVNARAHEYMPPTLLRSQFDALQPLEPDERGIALNVAETPATLVASVLGFLQDAGDGPDEGSCASPSAPPKRPASGP